ncbi:MAG: oligosaccharide flippase family protein [Armatimonadetes bacterium]|nr:oligosaccharide flippase family protein [Armatimonadota bacterium]
MAGLADRIRKRLDPETRGGSFLRATAALLAGSAAGQALTVLVSPIVARLYGQEQTATLGTFAIIVSSIAPVVCLRYEAALSMPEDDETAERLLWSCLLSTVAVSLATAVAVAFGGRWLADLCHDPELVPFLWLVPVSLAGLGLYQTFSYWAIRGRGFVDVARTRLVQGIAQSGTQVGLGLLKVGAAGLIVGDVLGRVAGGASLAVRSLRSVGRPRTADVLETAKAYREFPLYGGPAMILHTATTSIAFLIAPLYGPLPWGDYFFGIRFVWAPVALLGQAMAQVYLAEASRWARGDRARMLQSFDGITRRLAVVGAVPFGLLALAGGPLVGAVFGSKWQHAGFLVQIQSVTWWAMFVVGPVLNTLTVLKKQRLQLVIDAVGLALMGACFWAAWRYGLSLETTVVSYSVVMLAMYGALYWASRRSIVLPADAARTP